MCFIVDPQAPVITENCVVNNTINRVTHNISWYAGFTLGGTSYKLPIYFWVISGGCTYPNGTSINEVMR